MIETLIDLRILDLGNGKNPFDEIASHIERLKIEGKMSDGEFKLEKTLLLLERKFQDFSDSDVEKSKVIFQAVSANLGILESNINYSIEQISNNLNSILTISYKDTLLDLNNLSISKIIKKNYPKKNNISISELQKVFDTISKKVESDINKEEWIFELNFNTEKSENHKPLEFIHTFIEGLNTIDGVSLTLEYIEIGSIKARIKAVFDDVKSKEEVKDILESTQKFAKGKLEKDFIEGKKLDSDIIKNEMETKILEENLSTLQSSEIREFRQLENESVKLDLERKKLENEKLRIELFKEKKNLLKELLSEGIIDQKHFDMLINGLPFISMENGRLLIGETIDVIDKL